MMRADPALMKQLNRRSIRAVFRHEPLQTAGQLSTKTGLSVVTVNALLKEMVGAGELWEERSAPVQASAGRPSMSYRLNEVCRCAAVVCGYQKQGHDNISLNVVDLLGRTLHRVEQVFQQIGDDSFDALLDEAFARYPDIGIIGFGLPGAESDGTILLNDYPGLIGNTFMRHHEERYGVPVMFANDINAATCGYVLDPQMESQGMEAQGMEPQGMEPHVAPVCPPESKPTGTHVKERGMLWREDTVVGIFVPRGYHPGAGVVLHGRIHEGHGHFAGEIGCMPIGVDWKRLDHSDANALVDALGKLVAAIGCVIAPDLFMVYGEFCQLDLGARVAERASTLLKHRFDFQVQFSGKFEAHIEQGMIRLALDRLWDQA